MCVGIQRRLANRVHVGLGRTEPDVREHAAVEQERVLRDNSDVAVVVICREVAHIVGLPT